MGTWTVRTVRVSPPINAIKIISHHPPHPIPPPLRAQRIRHDCHVTPSRNDANARPSHHHHAFAPPPPLSTPTTPRCVKTRPPHETTPRPRPPSHTTRQNATATPNDTTTTQTPQNGSNAGRARQERPWDGHEGTDGRTYKVHPFFFYFSFISLMTTNLQHHHPPPPPENERNGSFSGVELSSGHHHHPHLSKTSTTTRFRVLGLLLASTTPKTSTTARFWGGWTFLWPPPPPTPLENEHDRSFSRVGPSSCQHHPENESVVRPPSGQHHHPHLSKTSTTAHFRGLGLPLATITTHTSWKQAVTLVFGGWPFLCLTPPHTNPGNEHDCSFSGVGPSSGHHHHPRPPKMSVTARFWRLGFLLATTTTQTSRKRVVMDTGHGYGYGGCGCRIVDFTPRSSRTP
jgi:hypothetical protein